MFDIGVEVKDDKSVGVCVCVCVCSIDQLTKEKRRLSFCSIDTSIIAINKERACDLATFGCRCV